MRDSVQTFVGLFALLLGLVVVVAAIGAIFDIDLSIGVRGSSGAELPKDWPTILGLGGGAAFLAGIAYACSRPALPGWAIAVASLGLPAALIAAIVMSMGDGYRWSDLELAAKDNDLEAVQVALEAPRLRGPDLPAAIYWALKHENLAMSEAIAIGLSKWDTAHNDLQRCRAFERAAHSKKITVVQQFLDAGLRAEGCPEFQSWLHDRTEHGSDELKTIARMLQIEIKH